MPYMYILRCADGTFYTGSTKHLQLRLEQHHNGEGSIYTSRRLPVKLAYYEKYDNVADAFEREKQIQGWGHAKKQALIDRNAEKLHELAIKPAERTNEV